MLPSWETIRNVANDLQFYDKVTVRVGRGSSAPVYCFAQNSFGQVCYKEARASRAVPWITTNEFVPRPAPRYSTVPLNPLLKQYKRTSLDPHLAREFARMNVAEPSPAFPGPMYAEVPRFTQGPIFAEPEHIPSGGRIPQHYNNSSFQWTRTAYVWAPAEQPIPQNVRTYQESLIGDDFWRGQAKPHKKSQSSRPTQTRRAHTTPRRKCSESTPKTYEPRRAHTDTAPKSDPGPWEEYIPAGYSRQHWDQSERPFVVLGSAFDGNTLGKWIYDWTVFVHKPGSPISEIAGDFWLSLIQLAGKTNRGADALRHIKYKKDRELVEDFVKGGERLMDRLWSLKTGKGLLKDCEDGMLEHRNANGRVTQGGGVAFIDNLFDREREFDKTEKLMTAMDIWSKRFDANCEDVLREAHKKRR